MAESVLDLSLVIACYNEEYELVDSVRQIVEILESARWSWELIFVDDVSRDRTRELIDRLIAQYPDKTFRKLFHDHNTGRGRTVSDGFHLARGRYVGYIDIDLEVHARYIPTMLLALEHGADVATAHRIYKVQPRLFNRFVASQGYAHLMRWLLGVHLKDTETGYKFFKRDRLLPLLDQVDQRALVLGYRDHGARRTGGSGHSGNSLPVRPPLRQTIHSERGARFDRLLQESVALPQRGAADSRRTGDGGRSDRFGDRSPAGRVTRVFVDLSSSHGTSSADAAVVWPLFFGPLRSHRC